jgi:hypothetical protein
VSIFLMALILSVLAFLIFLGVQALKSKIAAQRATERLKTSRLRRHADGEIELVRKNDMAGVYGEFPPPPAVHGTGIYIARDTHA